jgi:hypothetical protein
VTHQEQNVRARKLVITNTMLWRSLTIVFSRYRLLMCFHSLECLGGGHNPDKGSRASALGCTSTTCTAGMIAATQLLTGLSCLRSCEGRLERKSAS